jgi:branched-subunit amino acid ABC-type transport system permease component
VSPILTFVGIHSPSEFFQAVVNGLINGSAYGLVAVGFALVLSVTGRFHFAFALSYALAACVTAVLQGDHGVPLLPAAAVGVTAGAVVGILCEVWIYRPLAERAGNGALLPVFVASLGITVAGENAIRLLWGSASRTLSGVSSHSISVGSVTFSTVELGSVVIALALTIAVSLLLDRSSLGRMIKAVRVNPLMSIAIGIDLRRIYLIVFALGSTIGGVAALLQGIRFAVTPDMGIRPVFYGLVVAFLAGSAQSPVRLLVTGAGVGTVESVTGIWLNTNLSTVVVFALLFAYLSHLALRQALPGTIGSIARS